jgi:hypothetical protein
MAADRPRSDKPSWDPDDPRNDKVYLGILMALMATVFAAAAFSLVGDLLLQNAAMSQTGFYVAVVAGLVYFGFRFWGRAKAAQYQREKVRRELARDPAEDVDDDPDGTSKGPGGRAL